MPELNFISEGYIFQKVKRLLFHTHYCTFDKLQPKICINTCCSSVSFQTKVKDVLGEDFELVKHLEQEVTLEDILAHRTGLMAANIVAVAGFPAGESRSQFIR